jgi:hypothetical protein
VSDSQAKDLVIGRPKPEHSMCDICDKLPWAHRVTVTGIETLVCQQCWDETEAKHRRVHGRLE